MMYHLSGCSRILPRHKGRFFPPRATVAHYSMYHQRMSYGSIHAVYQYPRYSVNDKVCMHASIGSRSTHMEFGVSQTQSRYTHVTACQQSARASSSLKTTKGKIRVILGPMFAGKTSRLLKEAEELEEQGCVVLLLKSHVDSRYSTSHITTHDGKKKTCYALSELTHIQKVRGSDGVQAQYAACDVVAIDEAQFFAKDELVAFCQKAADEDGKYVILAGLDGDFKRNKFGYVLDVIPLADSVEKLSAVCHYCQDSAVFSKRIRGDAVRQELIGGAESYVSVCRQCYIDMK
jgi:thymidine kinase